MPTKILIIGDDLQAICKLRDELGKVAKYDISVFPITSDLNANIEKTLPDIILFDSIADSNVGICQQLFQLFDLPLIYLTNNTDSLTRVMALENGADDAVTMPITMRELTARMQAVMRRRAMLCRNSRTIVYDNLEIDGAARSVKVHGKPLHFPPKEFCLLLLLAENPNLPFSRDELIQKIWNYDYLGNSRTVDAHIKRLRKRLACASDKWAIENVWGTGYKFAVYK